MGSITMYSKSESVTLLNSLFMNRFFPNTTGVFVHLEFRFHVKVNGPESETISHQCLSDSIEFFVCCVCCTFFLAFRDKECIEFLSVQWNLDCSVKAFIVITPAGIIVRLNVSE